MQKGLTKRISGMSERVWYRLNRYNYDDIIAENE